MKKYGYLAINDFNEGFICEAYSKKQMKAAQMNMKLSWERFGTYEKARTELKCRGIELKHDVNVTNFKY